MLPVPVPGPRSPSLPVLCVPGGSTEPGGVGGGTDLSRWPQRCSRCCGHTGARPPPRLPGVAPGFRLPLASCRVSCAAGKASGRGQREGTAGVTQRFAQAVPPGEGRGGDGGVQPAVLAGHKSLPGARAAWHRYGPSGASPALRPPQPCSPRREPGAVSHPEDHSVQAPPRTTVSRRSDHRGSGDGQAPAALMWTSPRYGPAEGLLSPMLRVVGRLEATHLHQ